MKINNDKGFNEEYLDLNQRQAKHFRRKVMKENGWSHQYFGLKRHGDRRMTYHEHIVVEAAFDEVMSANLILNER